jgi:hypothetical protein
MGNLGCEILRHPGKEIIFFDFPAVVKWLLKDRCSGCRNRAINLKQQQEILGYIIFLLLHSSRSTEPLSMQLGRDNLQPENEELIVMMSLYDGGKFGICRSAICASILFAFIPIMLVYLVKSSWHDGYRQAVKDLPPAKPYQHTQTQRIGAILAPTDFHY